MRLSELILEEMPGILSDFEDFARTHTKAGATMDVAALRDHAEEMLRAFVVDMEGAQTADAQKRKSMGDAPVVAGADPTAAERHGGDRAGRGFTLEEMFAEYRALRASVLRHWPAAQGGPNDPGIDEMIRFNETIDQAVAESIMRYAAAVDESREMFVAVLGHDLRTPLSAVTSASAYLIENSETPRNREMATTVRQSSERMTELVSDMLDFALTRLGHGIPIRRASVDLGASLRPIVTELRVQHPSREFRFDASGDLTGAWDARRVGQALSNLIANAVQHGARESPITIVARGEDDGVVVAVRNRGNLIPPTELEHIFEPFRRRRAASDPTGTARSMGLGLYIARQIALAHEGSIDVDSSSERGTTFTLRLPRRASS